jgi:predicted GH43/DUF377 family glycosyl hydrolase
MRRLRIDIERYGTILEPLGEMEADGILNPGCVRGRDGGLYLFPRMVARGNYSRIGVARVKFDDRGRPIGAERLGIALEPTEEYERNGSAGGCEDPRVVYLEALETYVMTYTALTGNGARVAIATSPDLVTWSKQGLARFHPFGEIDIGALNNKDAGFFPMPTPNVSGTASIAMVHRPLFPEAELEKLRGDSQSRRADLMKESIWVSFSTCPLDPSRCHEERCAGLCDFEQHIRIAGPEQGWEKLKIGLGSPPTLLGSDFLLVYHGVSENSESLVYSAGAMTLDPGCVHLIRERTEAPFLVPELDHEREGTVPNVVFPTGIDPVPNTKDSYDLYYGMADYRIGCCRIKVQAD